MSILIHTLSFILQVSIYTLGFSSTSGTSVSMQSFQGKKVLLVNIASGSRYVSQLQELQQLQTQYKDSLVVIGFPSNSFGKEPLEDAAIEAFCKNNYGVTFLLARKAPVLGSDKQALYQWLTRQNENGVMEGEVTGDFQKYLIDQNGNLIGAWAPAIAPTDPSITQMLAN